MDELIDLLREPANFSILDANSDCVQIEIKEVNCEKFTFTLIHEGSALFAYPSTYKMRSAFRSYWWILIYSLSSKS